MAARKGGKKAAKKKGAKKKGAKKKGAKKKSAMSNAARNKAVNKSAKEVARAHKNLELALKKHKENLSAMFFII